LLIDVLFSRVNRWSRLFIGVFNFRGLTAGPACLLSFYFRGLTDGPACLLKLYAVLVLRISFIFRLIILKSHFTVYAQLYFPYGSFFPTVYLFPGIRSFPHFSIVFYLFAIHPISGVLQLSPPRRLPTCGWFSLSLLFTNSSLCGSERYCSSVSVQS